MFHAPCWPSRVCCDKGLDINFMDAVDAAHYEREALRREPCLEYFQSRVRQSSEYDINMLRGGAVKVAAMASTQPRLGSHFIGRMAYFVHSRAFLRRLEPPRWGDYSLRYSSYSTPLISPVWGV